MTSMPTTIPWHHNLSDALTEAGKQGKFVLLDFFSPT